MDVSNPKNGNGKAHVEEAAHEFWMDGKKLAHELYQEGANRVNEVEEQFKEYSDQLLHKVRKNPFTSVLIAGGVGFLLSKILK